MSCQDPERSRTDPSAIKQEESDEHQKPPGAPLDSGMYESPPVYVLCLGIGKISESRESQFQYLQLQDIAKFFKTSDVWVYDPMLDPVDVLLLEQSGFHLVERNQLGRHRLPIDRPALAYLPHCPRGLYEAFLRENWSGYRIGWRTKENDTNSKQHSAGQIVMIANDFGDYSLSLPLDQLRAESPCIATIAPLLMKSPLPHLPTNHAAFAAFSSLAWQHVPAIQQNRIEESPPVNETDHAVDTKPSGEMLASEIGEDPSSSAHKIQDSPTVSVAKQPVI
ncbi:hypothetical protein FFLO_06938 [Filobasidium floriforme]|uniref:SRR1-like domain-containing protein n=1 Tax=Filobasidium floriforme TaxID=5210 RepID=A0A8K0NMD4_9TREE|nr:uncharacterized protein HD553DRAFT_310814 [Filobasidium floriforme]KAG7527439.1 hypothetical protein FFLO_06938 [Filobasidium floriforme]KAH8085221.1 hypothetical protein HD553DRAFT_310814 [Filobasidium floriforme]